MERGTPLAKRLEIDHEHGGARYGCILLPRSAKAEARWTDPDYWISEWEYHEKHGRFPPGEARALKSERDAQSDEPYEKQESSVKFLLKAMERDAREEARRQKEEHRQSQRQHILDRIALLETPPVLVGDAIKIRSLKESLRKWK